MVLLSCILLTLLLLFFWTKKTFVTIKRAKSVWRMDDEGDRLEIFLLKFVLPLRSMVVPAAVLGLRISYGYRNLWSRHSDLEELLATLFDFGVAISWLVVLPVQCYIRVLSQEQHGNDSTIAQ